MPIEIKVPSPGESITEVEITRWIKSDGEYVRKDEELCEIESDKATLMIAAEADGILKILVQPGSVKVGTIVCSIDTSVAAPAKAAASQKLIEPEIAAQASGVAKSSESGQKSYATGIPSIAAKKIMEEQNIKSADINGTGKSGRVIKTDVLEKISSPKAASKPVQSQQANIPVTIFNGSRNIRREKMSKLRRKISERLVAVKNETAMLTTFNEVDMSAIMELRTRYKDAFKEKYGVGLGFMSLFTKASCVALKEFPAVNGMIDGEEIVYHDYADIGIAVSAPKGLMVPVIRNAESMSLWQIEAKIAELAKKAREGTISVDEMTNGTFTITNGGVFGSMLSTPILNPPQSAILGMHNIVERPVAVKGEVKIRPIMFLALSYDHRIIDGRESVSFLVKVKQVLEDPARMLLEI